MPKEAGGARPRRKGDRFEREIVALHAELGIHAERYPLSGASRFRGTGHDVDVYAFGVDASPFVAECKGRKKADGFRLLERWLGEYDLLFLRRDRCQPLVALPWHTYALLVERACRNTLPSFKSAPLAKTSAKHGVNDIGDDR